MKKALFLLALLVPAGQRALAQRVPLAASPALLSPAPAGPNSAAVLHQLFVRHRRAGRLALLVVPNIGYGINALSDPRGWRRAVGTLSVGANTGLLVLGVVDWVGFSRKREREALERLHQHQPLRPYVRRTYTAALVYAASQRP